MKKLTSAFNAMATPHFVENYMQKKEVEKWNNYRNF